MALIVIVPGRAFAVGVANDNFANATVISALPFTDSGDLNGTTLEPGEPDFCFPQAETDWYVLTPTASGTISVNLSGSEGAVSATVYQSSGGGFGGLTEVTCSGSSNGESFFATAGDTYYIQVGSLFTGSAPVELNVTTLQPPANDNFANATTIGSLPFSATEDTTAATTEPGEPLDLISSGAPVVATVWYTFRPATNEDLLATASSEFAPFTLAVYTGTSVSSLTQVATQGAGVFEAMAGTTYYLQLGRGNIFFGATAPESIQLEVAPPPSVNFFFEPPDPSIFDSIQFNDVSFDPAQVGLRSEAWTFGDGASATGCCPTHQYAVDGNYTVTLTVVTVDGRTATASQVVAVATHDVAVAKLSVPESARAGQTRTITVGISDSRYPEMVQVQLLTGSPNGFVVVGTSAQSVAAQGGNKTTTYKFNYTFTSSDAAIGKVTFEAVATIVGHRDALPTDNTAIALPTKVS